MEIVVRFGFSLARLGMGQWTTGRCTETKLGGRTALRSGSESSKLVEGSPRFEGDNSDDSL